MKAMKTGQAKGETALYDSHFNRYKELLTQLYDNLEYYAGTFSLDLLYADQAVDGIRRKPWKRQRITR